jgi:hypothetical protein
MPDFDDLLDTFEDDLDAAIASWVCAMCKGTGVVEVGMDGPEHIPGPCPVGCLDTAGVL